MSKPTIADSAIYQYTAQLAEKYKARRDELIEIVKEASAAFGATQRKSLYPKDHWCNRATELIAEVEQSL